MDTPYCGQMTDPEVLVATSVSYYDPNDESAFFGWLDKIPIVESYRGIGCDLLITLKRKPNKNDLQELIAFFTRYEIDLVQLARFETKSNRGWLRNPDAYWHGRMFGASSGSI